MTLTLPPADKDKGGTVDRYELGAALNRMGLGLKPAHVDALMEVFDEVRLGLWLR